MKKIVLIVSLFLISSQSFSQIFVVPNDYKLEKKEDYAKYEKDVIEGINWLLRTPVNNEEVRKKELMLSY